MVPQLCLQTIHCYLPICLNQTTADMSSTPGSLQMLPFGKASPAEPGLAVPGTHQAVGPPPPGAGHSAAAPWGLAQLPHGETLRTWPSHAGSELGTGDGDKWPRLKGAHVHNGEHPGRAR